MNLLNQNDFFEGQFNNLFDSKFLYNESALNFDFNKKIIINKMLWDTNYLKKRCYRIFFVKNEIKTKDFSNALKNKEFILVRTHCNNIRFLNLLYKNNFFIVNSKIYMCKNLKFLKNNKEKKYTGSKIKLWILKK